MAKAEPLVLPKGKKNLLLHSCCAPCAGDIMLSLCDAGIAYSIYFYNPNIHPKKEYEIRKAENIRFANKHDIPFIDADYDVENWFKKARPMADEPERGIRCTMCFDMRFVKTAEYAKNHGFDIISSTLGISRWKNMEQINACGIKAANLFEGIDYWTYNWRKGGGAARMVALSKEENFYKQEYCGCAYSLRDTNAWRVKNNRDKIKIGQAYYSHDD